MKIANELAVFFDIIDHDEHERKSYDVIREKIRILDEPKEHGSEVAQ